MTRNKSYTVPIMNGFETKIYDSNHKVIGRGIDRDAKKSLEKANIDRKNNE